MTTQSFRLPNELAQRLEAMAQASKRSQSSFVVEALELYLGESEDLEIARSRILDPGTEWVNHRDVGRELDLD
jgi:predicted DNA-binding protein